MQTNTHNKQLKYSKNAKIKSFTDEIEVQYSEMPRTVQNQVDEYFSLANQYRCAYPPVFADEQQYLPTSAMAQAVVEQQQAATQAATDAKTSAIADDVAKALVIGVGVFVLIKLLS